MGIGYDTIKSMTQFHGTFEEYVKRRNVYYETIYGEKFSKDISDLALRYVNNQIPSQKDIPSEVEDKIKEFKINFYNSTVRYLLDLKERGLLVERR